MKKIGCKIMDGLCFIANNLSVIGGVALVAIIVLTATDVILRLFSRSIIGNMELIQYLMIVLVFLSFGKATFDDSFIRVELFHFKGAEHAIRIVIDVLHVIVCLVAAYYCVQQSISAMNMGTSSQMLRIVRWPFVLLSGFGFLLIAVSIPLSHYWRKKHPKKEADS
jgi:TRAP-type C4-dicarboxylate transport system permease small subunit